MRRCWASLWIDRAVAYRAAGRVDQRSVRLAAVVQRMVPASVAGVLFTANPLTGRRREVVIDAAPGLGAALVSGSVNPDHFLVDLDSLTITERRPGGGQRSAGAGDGLCLTDAQVLDLARLGRRVEAHYRSSQDVEWALDARGRLWLLQARPITTLFPVPSTAGSGLRVYFSASLAQGVLQPITPMGLDVFRRAFSAGAGLAGVKVSPERGPAAFVPLAGRPYVDITEPLRTSSGRRLLGTVLGFMEARTGEALREVLSDPRLAGRRPAGAGGVSCG